jgi:hypothetical protein
MSATDQKMSLHGHTVQVFYQTVKNVALRSRGDVTRFFTA